MKRRILTSIRLDRIAAVDSPCQVHATAAIMKSRNTGAEAGLFMAKVAKIEKRDRCPRHRAMSKARSEHPEAFAAYQEGGEQPPERAEPEQPAELRKARTTFRGLVDAVQDRERVPRHVAMQKARRAYPDAFAAAWG